MYRVKVEQEAKDNLRTHYSNLQKHYPGSDYPVEWHHGIRAATAYELGDDPWIG